MALRGCPHCQAAATLPSQTAVEPRCPHPSREDREGSSSLLQPQNQGRVVQSLRVTLHGDNPSMLAPTSLLLQFPCCIGGNPVIEEVTVRRSSKAPSDSPFGCLTLQGPLPRSCSKPFVHPQVAPVSQGTGWALLCPYPTPCTYPVPRECPQKRMVLFPLRAFAQS